MKLSGKTIRKNKLFVHLFDWFIEFILKSTKEKSKWCIWKLATFKLFSNYPKKKSRSPSFWVLCSSTWKSQQELNWSNMASQLNLYVNYDSETWSPLVMVGSFAFKIIQKRFAFIGMRLMKVAGFSSFLWKNGSRNSCCTGVCDLESLQNWDLCIISGLIFDHWFGFPSCSSLEVLDRSYSSLLRAEELSFSSFSPPDKRSTTSTCW